MEEEGSGIRLSKRFSDKGEGEVDYKTKAGTAWSHNFLNQKPWHPLSYPNQRRKWIAEQTHAQRERRAEEVSREYAQEQEFFRQTALVSKKEKEKMEMMKAVSFMYVRPPGYNPESAKAAEVADEAKKQGMGTSEDTSAAGASTSGRPEVPPIPEKKKPRPKDVFGRSLPTEEEFEALKNAPKMETGVAGRAKPFGIEIRNVKCVRCGTFGHQSGDRECPLKDTIMPNEESRIKRDDPLTAILAQTDASEPLKWELKQKPGLSPPRGGFTLDDPNQQIVAEEIFDEYGGFLSGENIPDLLANFSTKPKKKKKSSKSKHRKRSSPTRTDLHDHKETSSSSDEDRGRTLKKKKHKSRNCSESPEDSDRHQRHSRSSRGNRSKSSSVDTDTDGHRKRSKNHSWSNRGNHSKLGSEHADNDRHRKRSNRHSRSIQGNHSESGSEDVGNDRHRKRSTRHSRSSLGNHSEAGSEDADNDRHRKRSNRYSRSSRGNHSESGSEDADNVRHRQRSNRHSRSSWGNHSETGSEDADNVRHRQRSNRHSRSSRGNHSESGSEDANNDRHRKRSNRHSDSDKERRKRNRRHHHHHSRHSHYDPS